MSDVHRIEKVLPDVTDPRKKVRAIRGDLDDCPQVTILNIEGALFFGAATKFEKEVLEHVPLIHMLIIRMGRVPVVDATGERALAKIAESCRRHKVRLMITGLQEQPEEVLKSTGLLRTIGPENVFARTGPAIESAIAQMETGICATCQYNAFRECPDLKLKGVALAAESRKEV
jgi:SulP family sulfate permease